MIDFLLSSPFGRNIRIVLLPLLVTLSAEGKDALPDFSSLSLQELSTVKVTSVSRTQQKLSRVAAAVYVITQEEIHRSGMTNVADVLRLVPGLAVARIDGSKWGVTSRGYNGRFASKLLVLVDGRSVYSPIFSGVYWDMNMPLLDNIDRIEVIRGPGAAVWGANAVSGVINIITKSASETTGVEVTTSAGSMERGGVQAQAGGRIGGRAYYRGYVAAADRSALQTADGQSAHDGWSEVQTGFRLDGTYRSGAWQLEGDLFRNHRDEATTVLAAGLQPGSATSYGTENGNSGDLAFEWRVRMSDTSDLRVNASYDYVDRPEFGLTRAQTSIGSLDLQYHFTAGEHHDISIGVGDRLVSDDVDGPGLVVFRPSNLEYQTSSAFGQDEIHLWNDRVLLTAGIKLEYDVLGGRQTQPTVRALWAPNRNHSAWVSASRAIRTPTFYEHYAHVAVGTIAASAETFGLPVAVTVNGSPSIKEEISKDYELGYRAQFSPRFSVDLASFYTHYDNLRTSTPEDMTLVYGAQPHLSSPYLFTNFAKGHSEGGEIALTCHPASQWKIASSYSYLNSHVALTAAAAPGSASSVYNETPAHQFRLQSYWNLAKSVQLDTHLFYSSAFPALYFYTSTAIPSHLRADVRLGWRIKPRWEVSLVGQDLGSRRLLELPSEVFSPETYTSRGFYVKNTWRF